MQTPVTDEIVPLFLTQRMMDKLVYLPFQGNHSGQE